MAYRMYWHVNYNQWEASQPEGMSDAEKLAKFRQEHSGIFSSGAWKVRMHQALLGVASAVVGLAKSAVGTYEAATGSHGALELYEKLSRDASSISASSAALPTGQWVHLGTSMVVSSAPSLGVGGLVSLTLKAGGAAFGLRTAAQVAQAAQTWGLRGTAATAGLQTFGGMYGDAVQGYMNRGDSESTALNKAFIPALAGAASTYLLTAAGGTQGIEALLRQPAFKENFRQWFKAVAAGSVKEGLREEAPDQLIQGIIERYTYNPDKPWKDIIEETLQAGIGGALLGGGVEATTTSLAPSGTNQDQPQPTIPSNTTPAAQDGSGQPKPATTDGGQQTQTPPAAADLKEVGQVLDNIQRLQDKAKDGPLSLAEQRELDHNEKVLAHTRVKNLEKEQQVIRSLPQPRELDPHKAQKLEEARAVLQRPVPGEPPAATPSQSSIPDTTTPTSPESGHPASVQSARSLPDPAKNSEAIDGIERLTDKAKTGVLSPAEKRELDQHEKTRAATRVHHLEAEQKALSELNPPRELNPVKAQALETERAILQRPVPGEPSAGGGTGEPAAVPSNNGEASPRPLPGNDGHGGGVPPPPPPPPPPSEGNSSKGSTIQGQNAADAGQHGGSATVDVPAPGPRFHEKNPDILDQHRKKFKEKRDAPRDTKAEAALLKERDERVRNAQPASEALHRHNEAGSLKFVRNMGDTNEANLLKAPDGNAAVHKPADGQSPKKMRAGIAPEKTIHREVAASKIAQALGIDLVPPTNYMTHNDRHGSAQGFKSGMSNGIDAAADHNIQLDPRTQAPVDLPPDIAHDWQLTDDLLMHSDRLAQNYMLRVENGKIAEAALVDNGLSLPANTGVVEKRFPGPLEDQPISPLNEARLHRMLDNEESLRHSLKEHLEPEAIDGLFARAKALLARGKYGNFTLDEINAHLPPDKQPSRAVHWGDKSQ